MVCAHCGSSNIVADASATWNIEKQDWELSDVHEAAFCGECCEECDVDEVTVEQHADRMRGNELAGV